MGVNYPSGSSGPHSGSAELTLGRSRKARVLGQEAYDR
jgi:hypothetical protein